MRKAKKFLVGLVLVSAMAMQSAVVFAGEGSCTHDWTTYSFEKVYEGEKDCYEHDLCLIHEVGYNVIDICRKCGEKKQRHFTQLTHNYITR